MSQAYQTPQDIKFTKPRKKICIFSLQLQHNQILLFNLWNDFSVREGACFYQQGRSLCQNSTFCDEQLVKYLLISVSDYFNSNLEPI